MNEIWKNKSINHYKYIDSVVDRIMKWIKLKESGAENNCLWIKIVLFILIFY